MMAPYMPLFVADYLADTVHLTAAENGGYLLLIMNYWQRQKPLPDDDRKLAAIARMTPAEWAESRDTIAEFFDIRDGAWHHKRVDAELAGLVEKSEKAKAAGRASGAARAAKSNADPTTVEQPLNGCSTTDEPSDQIRGDKGKGDQTREIDNPISLVQFPRKPEAPRPVAKPFPEDGSISYGRFAEISRKAKPNVDPDVVAQAFRSFCRSQAPPIPFDDPRIERRFEGFARNHQIRGH
jgi:uncharacterized protein YdaU (DUF1376 family)